MKVLSLFDGMSCGRLALERANIPVEVYVASEVKDFAIRHTANKFPDTIEAGDVTKLHYDKTTKKLYRNCRRWAVVDNIDVMSSEHQVKNGDNITSLMGKTVIDVVNLVFSSDFDENNKILANYKDTGLVINAANLNKDDLDSYIRDGYEVLPNGEIVQWEVTEPAIYDGDFDMLIGGSPCQDFSMASSANDGKYGLEGSKSRLFFDYLRLRAEVEPKYFFLENVEMRSDSRAALDKFLGVKGVSLNSNSLSIQSRPRIYWTNIADIQAPEDKELNFQDYRIKTLKRLEYALYVSKFPGSYFGYDETSPKYDAGFEFDDEERAEIAKYLRIKENGIIDIGFTEDEAREIANMSSNVWVRKELEAFYGRSLTDTEFVDELHQALYESLPNKSPSRDNMRNGKEGFGSKCKNITYETKMSCLTRKQDRFPNSGIIDFGPYYRFVNRFEICLGQTVPYAFLGDLSYSQIQDVCGDGWTVDVIAYIFGLIGKAENIQVSKEGEEGVMETYSKNIFKKVEKKTRSRYACETTQITIPVPAKEEILEVCKKYRKDYIPPKADNSFVTRDMVFSRICKVLLGDMGEIEKYLSDPSYLNGKTKEDISKELYDFIVKDVAVSLSENDISKNNAALWLLKNGIVG